MKELELHLDLIKQVNDKLADEESKKIFAMRVLYSLTLDEQYLYCLGHEVEKKVEADSSWKEYISILEKAQSGDGLFLYGAGAYGEKMLKMTPNISWRGVIDKKPKTDTLSGVAIVSTSEFLSKPGNSKIVVSSKRYYEDIVRNLTENGVDVDRIVDGRVLYDLTEGKQYFDLDKLPHIDGQEVFIDAGACDGMSTVQFLKWCEGNGYSFCFEPDGRNIDNIKANMVDKKVNAEAYCIVPKGAWDKQCRLSFVATGNATSHIVEGEIADAIGDTESIETNSIDNEAGDMAVSFIKMDIEGAELRALYGAENAIRNNKPKLAICVYHNPEDIFEIPEYILRIRPDYKLYLRHYSFDGTETVLYAI